MRAHAPGSLTGLYAPPPPDESEAPSRGASVAVADGVTVDLEPAAETVVALDGDRVDFEPVELVLADLDVTADVSVAPAVPVGAGFGASGAATLAAALAADAEFDLGRGREALVMASHRAELEAGTGQGDVFIQDRGGFLWSGPGGDINRRELSGTIQWESAGAIDTAAVLADDDFRATAASVGPTHIDALGDAPTLRGFLGRSRDYLAATELATAWASERIQRVDAAGGEASMALFGETVFGVEAEGVLANRTTVSTTGARVVSD